MARSMKEVHTINYYPINEGAARRAKEMNSFSDYKEGSATAEYRAMVDKAAAIAEKQKSRVDPMYHEKIDHLLDTCQFPGGKEGKTEPGPGQQHGGMAVYSRAAG